MPKLGQASTATGEVGHASTATVLDLFFCFFFGSKELASTNVTPRDLANVIVKKTETPLQIFTRITASIYTRSVSSYI